MVIKFVKLFGAATISLWLFALQYRGLGLPVLDSAIVPSCVLIFSIALIFANISED